MLSKDLKKNVDLSRVGVIHAHSLFSDGAVALKIYEEYQIPYIVTVRNTDINYFYKYRPDLRGLCWNVLRHAHRVVFVTPSYRGWLLKRQPIRLDERIEYKAVVVPNGIPDFWLERSPCSWEGWSRNLRLLYVGDFSKNKNIPNLLKAAKLLSKHRKVLVSLVGGGGDGEREVREMLSSSEYNFVDRLGRINDRERLLDIYRAHDIFVMPSYRETFGIVYVEALSQGVPVIYSQGQGIDGYFDDGEVGESVDPHDPGDIQKKIDLIAGRLPGMHKACVAAANKFNWNEIIMKYIDYYRDAMNE